jgi:hypothetical protein
MLHRAKVAICCMNCTKHINILHKQNVNFLNVKPGGTKINRWSLKGEEGGRRSMHDVSAERLNINGILYFSLWSNIQNRMKYFENGRCFFRQVQS